jgi:hypothetical protein
LPSKSALQKSLGTAWNKASEVHARLSQERTAEKAERRRLAARKIGRSAVRKGHQMARRLRPDPFRSPSVPISVVPVEPIAQPVLIPVSEGVQEDLVVTPAAPSVPTPRRVVTWPALVVAAPAFVAIWAGWVAIGKMTGFGPVNLLPGFGDGLTIDTAITLPVGVEAYAGYAFYVALNPAAPKKARTFAAWSACLAVVLGMGGQTAYHLMSAAHMVLAPWQITTVVSCLPVAVFGLVAALVHMVRAGKES